MGCCMSVKKQRELEEEEMGSQCQEPVPVLPGARWASVSAWSLGWMSFAHSAQVLSPLSYEFSPTVKGAREGEEEAQGRLGSIKKLDRRRRRPRRRWRRWSFDQIFKLFLILFVLGEEGVGRVSKPNGYQGGHPEEILQEVKWTENQETTWKCDNNWVIFVRPHNYILHKYSVTNGNKLGKKWTLCVLTMKQEW